MAKSFDFIGIPRQNGNSDMLCSQFAEGARQAGNQVRNDFPAQPKIHYCTGCGVCNTSHQCVCRTIWPKFWDKMVAADVIVLATPVYFTRWMHS